MNKRFYRSDIYGDGTESVGITEDSHISDPEGKSKEERHESRPGANNFKSYL